MTSQWSIIRGNIISHHPFACQQKVIELWSTKRPVYMSWQNNANDMLTNNFACRQELCVQHIPRNLHTVLYWCRDHFVYAPNQWETTLRCNVVSHWLGACTNWSLLVFLLCFGNSLFYDCLSASEVTLKNMSVCIPLIHWQPISYHNQTKHNNIIDRQTDRQTEGCKWQQYPFGLRAEGWK